MEASSQRSFVSPTKFIVHGGSFGGCPLINPARQTLLHRFIDSGSHNPVRLKYVPLTAGEK